jgi:hypothetical protein
LSAETGAKEGEEMKRISVLLVVLAVVLVGVVPATAGPKIEASGDWTYAPTGPPVVRVAGPNTFVYAPDAGVWAGTFVGTSDEDFVVVCHRSFNFYKGVMTFTGTVEDGSAEPPTGTMVIKTNGKQDAISPDCGPVFDADWIGHWVIIGGTGELADVHGHGTFQGLPGTLTYEGQIHFS